MIYLGNNGFVAARNIKRIEPWRGGKTRVETFDNCIMECEIPASELAEMVNKEIYAINPNELPVRE